MTEPRGIRNNNPGNIRWGDSWQGLVDISNRTDKSFCQFVSAKWGIRALAKILLVYQDKHGLDTVEKIINRWAPPVENNTEAYVQAVAQYMNVDSTAQIDVRKEALMRPLVEGIIKHENGEMPYSRATIDQGLVLAGVLS